MKLKPSLREKKRYVVVKVISDSNKKFNYKDIKESFDKALQDFFGILMLSKASPMLLKEKFNKENQTLVIKISNKYVKELKAALTLIKKINNEKVIVKSLICSGTLKKATSYLEK